MGSLCLFIWIDTGEHMVLNRSREASPTVRDGGLKRFKGGTNTRLGREAGRPPRRAGGRSAGQASRDVSNRRGSEFAPYMRGELAPTSRARGRPAHGRQPRRGGAGALTARGGHLGPSASAGNPTLPRLRYPTSIEHRPPAAGACGLRAGAGKRRTPQPRAARSDVDVRGWGRRQKRARCAAASDVDALPPPPPFPIPPASDGSHRPMTIEHSSHARRTDRPPPWREPTPPTPAPFRCRRGPTSRTTPARPSEARSAPPADPASRPSPPCRGRGRRRPSGRSATGSRRSSRERRVLDVPEVELDPLGPRQRRAAVDLRPARHPRVEASRPRWRSV